MRHVMRPALGIVPASSEVLQNANRPETFYVSLESRINPGISLKLTCMAFSWNIQEHVRDGSY